MADVRMTEEQFAAALKSAAEGGAKVALAARGESRQPEGGDRGILRDPEELLRAIRTRKGPAPNRYIPCKSPMTGATFVVVVGYSRPYPAGRVLDLRDYTLPTEASRHEPTEQEIAANNGAVPANAGRVPLGMEMTGADGKETMNYKQWKYENFSLLDRRQYASGHAFVEALRTGPDLPTPDSELTAAEREAKEIAAA